MNGKYKKDFSLNALLGQYKCKFARQGLLALTPAVLDLLADDEMLIDFYGNEKSVGEFKKLRKGKLYPDANGGPTIYCFKY